MRPRRSLLLRSSLSGSCLRLKNSDQSYQSNSSYLRSKRQSEILLKHLRIRFKYLYLKTTSEKALFKASKVLGINRLLANIRDIYVADTAESFDNLAKVAGGSLYDEIIEKWTVAESDLLKV